MRGVLYRRLIAIAFWWTLAILTVPLTGLAQPEAELADSTLVDTVWTQWEPSSQAVDTAAVAADFRRGWLFPVGLIAATGTIVFLLFSTRSR